MSFDQETEKKLQEWASKEIKEAEEFIDDEEDLDRIVLMNKFTPVPYSKKLMKNNYFIFDKYKRFWRYDRNDGVWKMDAEIWIKNKLRRVLMGSTEQKVNYTNEVVAYIRDLCYDPEFDPNLEDYLIPFENCIFDLRTGLIIKFDPRYFVTNKIPHKLNPKYTECPTIDKFFKEVVATEDFSQMLYDLSSYCLYRGYPYQKLFFLFGAGKNGKSTFLEMLRSFLGQDNVASVSPQHICDGQRFALAGMWNKVANISNDISYKILEDTNKLKELSGNDTISVEFKYQSPFPAKLYAKQIFSTNQLPMVNDKTYAWCRRLYLIEFPHIIEKPDPFLLSKLTTEKEMMGFAWKCVQNLKNLYDRNFIFEFDPDVEKITNLYEDLSSPLKKFLRENTQEVLNAYVFKFEFNERFWKWLEDHKLRKWSDKEISIEMKKDYEEVKKQWLSDGEPRYYRAYDNLKLNEGFGQVGQEIQHFKTISLYVRTSLKEVSYQSHLSHTEQISNFKFKSLKNLDFALMKDGKSLEIFLKKGEIYELFELGDDPEKVFKILKEEGFVEKVTEEKI